MCGRTACTLAPGEVSRACSYRTRGGQRRQPRWRDGDEDKYRPSYNKSPQSTSPVLLSQRHFDQGAPVDECVLASMRWGLIPAWCKENKMQYSTSNCRSESILQKKTFKVHTPFEALPKCLLHSQEGLIAVVSSQDPLIKGQRCVVLADGFYEWRRQEKDKQPFFIYFPQTQATSLKTESEDNPMTSPHSTGSSEMEASADVKEGGQAPGEWTGWKLLTMAGLFDCWTPPDGGEPLYTYSVITVNASPGLESIHHRMPAILDGEEEVRKWLDFGEVKSQDALKLLESKNILTFHPVSSLVNNSRNNSPECLQPVDLNSKKEPKPTASSKMMRSWLKSGVSSKRKEPNEEQEIKTKPAGGLQLWLQGAQKKPRTT